MRMSHSYNHKCYNSLFLLDFKIIFFDKYERSSNMKRYQLIKSQKLLKLFFLKQTADTKNVVVVVVLISNWNYLWVSEITKNNLASCCQKLVHLGQERDAWHFNLIILNFYYNRLLKIKSILNPPSNVYYIIFLQFVNINFIVKAIHT